MENNLKTLRWNISETTHLIFVKLTTNFACLLMCVLIIFLNVTLKVIFVYNYLVTNCAVAGFFMIWFNHILVADQLYKHCCLCVCVCVCACPWFVQDFYLALQSLTKAGKAPDSCQTWRTWRQMPTPCLPTQLWNYCSRIVLVYTEDTQCLLENFQLTLGTSCRWW